MQLTRSEWYKLWHSWRWAKRTMAFEEAVAWIAGFSWESAKLLLWKGL